MFSRAGAYISLMFGRRLIIFAPCDARFDVMIGGSARFLCRIRRSGETRTAEATLTIFLSRIFLSGVSPAGKCGTGECGWISSEVRLQFD
jgi:hypothetical protein